MFAAFGPKTQLVYDENSPRSVESITDTVYYDKGEVIQTYPALEFRLSSRFILTPELSLKAGIQRNFQYLQMITNTASMTPTDIWKLSDNYILPQRGDQISLWDFTGILMSRRLKCLLRHIIKTLIIFSITKGELNCL